MPPPPSVRLGCRPGANRRSIFCPAASLLPSSSLTGLPGHRPEDRGACASKRRAAAAQGRRRAQACCVCQPRRGQPAPGPARVRRRACARLLPRRPVSRPLSRWPPRRSRWTTSGRASQSPPSARSALFELTLSRCWVAGWARPLGRCSRCCLLPAWRVAAPQRRTVRQQTDSRSTPAPCPPTNRSRFCRRWRAPRSRRAARGALGRRSAPPPRAAACRR